MRVIKDDIAVRYNRLLTLLNQLENRPYIDQKVIRSVQYEMTHLDHMYDCCLSRDPLNTTLLLRDTSLRYYYVPKVNHQDMSNTVDPVIYTNHNPVTGYDDRNAIITVYQSHAPKTNEKESDIDESEVVDVDKDFGHKRQRK
jgi:hypothetical protein